VRPLPESSVNAGTRDWSFSYIPRREVEPCIAALAVNLWVLLK
jgi:hypothetical protein